MSTSTSRVIKEYSNWTADNLCIACAVVIVCGLTDDMRKILPRLQDENIEHNLKIVTILEDMAFKKHATATQIALSWVLAQWDNIVVIPGTRRIKYLEENLKTQDIRLSEDELNYLDNSIPFRFAQGARLPKEFLKILNNYELP